ncbi:bifunctional protein-serine/threonine kinase/phosphatase [uncultured Pseudoteredinibacter sp.]|uniref:bifunctional protein-serine/threonine kinase/phosphatase n=1 Tax=uncultured Pseudoteredinibacter sp. TaxID=1641701 RepID=UPI0026365972|nr:bifunctional protein-serine/threonine kinase/phosphatase [uncultured Pseudoteredinibacter sp.]
MAETLKLSAASLCETGRKQPKINEDFAAIHIPEDPHLLRSKGIVLAVADGVSSAGAGREASEQAVKRFIQEYYQTPDTWSVSHCGENILSTINLRLYRRSHEYGSEGKGYLSTFSALVIKGQTAHFFHIGDSRIYYLSEQDRVLKCLSRDHSRKVTESQSFLTRAIGMDNHLPLDYGQQAIGKGDRFLLSSDGLHDFVAHQDLQASLKNKPCDRSHVCALFDQALSNGSDDNVSVIVADIECLPESPFEDSNEKSKRLPFPPDSLAKGVQLDGYIIEKELFSSSRSQLYLVKDKESKNRYAMKIPSRNFEDDESYIERFVQEEWIGQRIKSDHVVKVIRPQRQKTALYYLMEYIEGQSLDKWINDHQPPSPKRSIAIIEQIAKGLQAFHDNEAIHQDLKPANVMIDIEGRVLIVDFGSVYVAGLAELRCPDIFEAALGTASYSDPIYLLGRNPGIAGDVYSLATIAYEMFTGQLPYGPAVDEYTSAAQYHRLSYIPASEHNPVIPIWFDRALRRGVEFDLEDRYRTVSDFYQDLRNPNPDFLREDPPSQSNSSGLLFWKLLSGFWFGVFVLLLYLFTQVS